MKKRNDWLTLQPTEEQKLGLQLAKASCDLNALECRYMDAELRFYQIRNTAVQLARESDLACGYKGTHCVRGFVRSPPEQYRRLPFPLSLRQQPRALPQSGQERLAILQARNTGQNIGGYLYEKLLHRFVTTTNRVAIYIGTSELLHPHPGLFISASEQQFGPVLDVSTGGRS